MPNEAIRALIALCVLIMFFPSAHAGSSGGGNPIFNQSYFDNLDYGLYWAGANNQLEKAGANTASGSRFYSRTKPTLIYIHGWQPNSSKNQTRELFFSETSGRPNIDFAKMWRDAGYNIGIIYWNQFADEIELKDAEAKIWSANGPKKMRWRDSHGDYHSGPDESVAELLKNDYTQALSQYSGGDIRIAGHSLGNQVALQISHLLLQAALRDEISAQIVPQRVSLLDAFYSKGGKSYLSEQWTGEVARTIADQLIDEDIVIDSYRTSVLTTQILVGDENRGLHNKAAFVEMGTNFFWQFQQTEKHVAAVWLYLWSIDSQAPFVKGYNNRGISAASSNEDIRFWMNTNHRLVQDEGRDTKTPADNKFESDSRL